MALSPSQLNYFPLLKPQFYYFNNSFRNLKFKTRSSSETTELDTQEPKPVKLAAIHAPKKKRKPRPSFFEQIQEKWSTKIVSTREKLPWQEEEEGKGEDEEMKKEQSLGIAKSEQEIDSEFRVFGGDPVSFSLPSPVISPPWVHGSKPNFDSSPQISEFRSSTEDDVGIDIFGESSNLDDEFYSDKPSKNFEGNFEEISDNDGGLVERDGREMKKRSNTMMAEKMIPEHELRRLRNVSLRMYERTKVGAAGITQALVEHIHEKWRWDEVVKLKFEVLEKFEIELEF